MSLMDWIDERIHLKELIKGQLTEYYVPEEINLWYSLGGLALFIFIVQVLTGILLLVYYIPHTDFAYDSIQRIMTQVPYGWLIRLVHAVGATMMIAAVTLHMVSVLFMGSYKKPRELHWMSGFLLMLLTLGIALSGYLLPWSQLSYWGTTVATNAAGTVPWIGPELNRFLRGQEIVGGPTLSRFYAMHVALIPATMVLLVALHLFLIRRTGISDPPGR